MYRLIGHYRRSLDPLLTIAKSFTLYPSGGGYMCTDWDATRPHFEPLVRDHFPRPWAGCFLAVIWPGGNIMPHEGIGERIEPGALRYHLVLQTNEHCWNMHANDWQRLEVGGIYEMDPRLVHASINWGAELRMHLVVDQF